MNDQRRVAEERLKNAIRQFGEVSSDRLRHLIKDVEGDLSSSVLGISHSVVEGLQEIKSELSVAAAVRRRPLPWLAGAVTLGAAAGVAFGRADSGNTRPNPGWALLLAEAGWALLKASRGDGGA